MLADDELAEAVKKYSLEGFLRRHPFSIKPITPLELERECRAFEDQEPRDAMYRVSTFLVREWWSDPARLVDALSVLLLVWNGAFYRYGGFDENALEICLRENQGKLNGYRERDISSFSELNGGDVQGLFLSLSQALKRASDGVESPVSAGKALHLLAPSLFPLWDQYIAPAYACPYKGELASVAYIAFARRVRVIAVQLKAEMASTDEEQKEWLLRKPLLKRIDEYNYMRYTVTAMERKRAKPE